MFLNSWVYSHSFYKDVKGFKVVFVCLDCVEFYNQLYFLRKTKCRIKEKKSSCFFFFLDYSYPWGRKLLGKQILTCLSTQLNSRDFTRPLGVLTEFCAWHPGNVDGLNPRCFDYRGNYLRVRPGWFPFRVNLSNKLPLDFIVIEMLN